MSGSQVNVSCDLRHKGLEHFHRAVTPPLCPCSSGLSLSGTAAWPDGLQPGQRVWLVLLEG